MVERTSQHLEDFYYKQDMFKKTVERLIKAIKNTNKEYKNIYAIPRGGLIFGVYLSHALNLPMVYDTNTIVLDTLIVDDICDTGNTLKLFSGLTKVCLIVKPKGLNITKDLIYDIKVEDHVWVHFPWEKKI